MRLYRLEFKCKYVRHRIKKYMVMNENVSELEDSTREVLVAMTPEMCLQVMPSVPFAVLRAVGRPKLLSFVCSREFTLLG